MDFALRFSQREYIVLNSIGTCARAPALSLKVVLRELVCKPNQPAANFAGEISLLIIPVLRTQHRLRAPGMRLLQLPRNISIVLLRYCIPAIPVLMLVNLACEQSRPAFPPDHYLIVSHPALNRLTIFDLSTDTIVGALPTQKLPHDMLVSHDGILYVVNSGSQCITTFDLKNPEFWDYARNFMKKDSANLYAPKSPPANMMGQEQPGQGRKKVPETAAWTNLNRDPVQSLPTAFAHTYLTDTLFPEIARPMHEKIHAFSHTACYDCHDRSVGAKPFGPAFTRDSATIFLVHLKERNITFLDAKTLALKRQIPLPIPARYSPIETWVEPDQSTCFVTCRNEIGQSKPGLILVVDLTDGRLLKTIIGGIYPWHLVSNASDTRLYVDNFQSSRISVVDVAKREIVDSLVVQNGPSMMTFVPRTDVLAVSCFYTDRVLFVNVKTKQVEKTIDVDSNPTSLEFTHDGTQLYVLCGGESSLDIIDLQKSAIKARYKMLFGAYAFHIIHQNQFID